MNLYLIMICPIFRTSITPPIIGTQHMFNKQLYSEEINEWNTETHTNELKVQRVENPMSSSAKLLSEICFVTLLMHSFSSFLEGKQLSSFLSNTSIFLLQVRSEEQPVLAFNKMRNYMAGITGNKTKSSHLFPWDLVLLCVLVGKIC